MKTSKKNTERIPYFTSILNCNIAKIQYCILMFLTLFFNKQSYGQDSQIPLYQSTTALTSITFINNDLSGITWVEDTNTFYMIQNSGGKIWETDSNFNLLRTISMSGFGDSEDLVYLGNNEFAIVNEASKFYIGTISSNVTSINANAFQEITFDNPAGNLGPEGIAYDTDSQIFYIVKEKSPRKIYKINRPTGSDNITVTPEIPFDAQTVFAGIASDLSAVYFDNLTDRLWVLSHESHKIVDVAIDGTIYGELALADASQHEGLTVDANEVLYVTSEANRYRIYEKNTQAVTDYHVGPGQSLATISEVPWATLQAGDRVFIHWRDTPYKEKWVINRQGTADNRIQIIGVNGPQGQQPVIDGNGATTVAGVNFWNDQRGVIKIGGSNTPADGLPNYITIENLEVRSGRQPYQFTDESGQTQSYSANAAAIYVEKAANLIIRNCTLHDSGNGLFIGADNGSTENILIEKNYFYDNGIVGSIHQHNAYTAAIGITYQYNRFGSLRAGANGNNLKDRSAGLVVRYNWVEGGNRQLDLVDAEDSQVLVNHPSYNTTHVYGNVLIEPDGAGNSQIVHYGGDSGTTADYRKGDLYFYNNTVISTRTNTTTLIALSTNDETAHIFNNVMYPSASGNLFAMISNNGTCNMNHNWLKTGWKDSHQSSPNGVVNDQGSNNTGSDPLFQDFNNQDFSLQESSPLINQGDVIPASLLPDHNVISQYVKHQDFIDRTISGNFDIGAFEYNSNLSVGDEVFNISVLVTPNPTSTFFNIEIEENSILESVIIYNELGQFIKKVSESKVDISNLTTGLYFVKITSLDGNTVVKKVIKT
ncbi:SdiA-regulated domain-containing protein [Aquimarina sp. 2201CG5-10]|uniref:SdiA-regulated domain-containing protein n=1 Tax=Aquimarina callyspongiae TaxID=3098150 RepID=UPI002AB4E7A1|nr:SdiA-regulated domain-containing protein [Aquimarina sp. 2201CG5-10]MDY8136055.1 SdiA-regulated domain-containing protein [Aquimarina sp. 2201CG5-10]